MKPFGKRRDHRLELPTSGLTGRQLTTIAVAFALAIVLVPVGARAAQFVNAIITDPTDAHNQAHVDASGNLQVGGTVKASQSGDWAVGLEAGTVVASTPGVPFQKNVFGSDTGFVFAEITGIPEGKKLIVTHISGRLSCSPEEGQEFAACDLVRIGLDRSTVSHADFELGYAEPTRQVSRDGVRYFFNDDYLAVLEPFVGEDPAVFGAVDGFGHLFLDGLVSGYLVDV